MGDYNWTGGGINMGRDPLNGVPTVAIDETECLSRFEFEIIRHSSIKSV